MLMRVDRRSNARRLSCTWSGRWRIWRALCVSVLIFCAASAQARDGAVASAHPLASRAGEAMLDRGGNAFDAAVATAAVLAVVEPYSSGFGGGGFFLLHRASDGFETMVDGRETAPAAARRGHYFDAAGQPIPGATTRGGTAVAVPGAAALLEHVARRYGSLPLTELLAPAIRHARDGFAVDDRYARIAKARADRLHPEAARIFLDDGGAPAAGWTLRQPELAVTLDVLAREGASGFYRGAVARALVEAVNRAGGAWEEADLAGYRVVERAPIRFRYRDATITTAALPSAGGIALAQALRILEHFELDSVRSPRSAHLVAETLRRVFRDRARHLGDSDFVAVPVERLTSPAHARAAAVSIDPGRATPSAALGSDAAAGGGTSTTHLSVIDAAGNRVAATLTINLLFGSGMVVPGTGVLLNNEMDDFSLGPDVANAFRLRGGEANAIAPGKRPLSSMTPTFVEDAKGVLVFGTPGGSRIVSQVLLATLDYVHSAQPDPDWLVRAPRYHHQWWPDRIEFEPGGFPDAWRESLQGLGHEVAAAGRRWGNMQIVFRPTAGGAVRAARDPRGLEYGWY